jgi:hypothetical protein
VLREREREREGGLVSSSQDKTLKTLTAHDGPEFGRRDGACVSFDAREGGRGAALVGERASERARVRVGGVGGGVGGIS